MRCRAIFADSLPLGLFAVLLLPAALGAQVPAAGERVRVTYRPAGLAIGTLQPWSGDTLVVHDPSAGLAVRIPLDSLTRLQVSEGRKGNASTGRLVGAAVLGTAAVLYTWDYCLEGKSGCSTLMGGAGALLGLVVGGFVGSRVKDESWRRIELDGIRGQADASRTRHE